MLKIRLFQRWGRIEDLEKAVEKGKHAVAETREENEVYAESLNNFGVILESRYERTGTIEGLEEALQVAQHAWRCKNATPFVRVRASTGFSVTSKSTGLRKRLQSLGAGY